MTLSNKQKTEADEQPLQAHRFPEPGEILDGRYRIDRLLGIGGYARVFAATQLEIERRVALKVMSTWTTRSGLTTVEKRFYREARLLSRLRGSNTIQMFDYGRTDDLLFLVFEFIEGRDLAQVLEEPGRLGEERAVRIVVQILRSLREAHANDILHRDIKPANVMVYDHLGEPDCVKVLDFGIAKAVAAEAAGQSNLTVEGGVIGTPRYMSPEQSRGLMLSPPSDLFSVGLVLYEMLVGEPALESGELSLVQRTLSRERITLPESVVVSQRTRSVVDGLLAPQMAERFESADAVLAALGHPSESHLTGAERSVESSAGFPMLVTPEDTTIADLPSQTKTTKWRVPHGVSDPTIAESSASEQVPEIVGEQPDAESRRRVGGVGALVAAAAVAGLGALLWFSWPADEAPSTQIPQHSVQDEIAPVAPDEPVDEGPEDPAEEIAGHVELPDTSNSRALDSAVGEAFQAAGRRVLRSSIAGRAASEARAEAATLDAEKREPQRRPNRPRRSQARKPSQSAPNVSPTQSEQSEQSEPVRFAPVDEL